MPKQATIQDVAQLAGVSRGTVSRVLNGSPRVSPAARKAVEAAVKKSNYRANPHARSLASGRNNAIAVLLTQPQHELFADPTFSLLLQGVSDGLADTETALVLLLAGNDEERRRTATFLGSRHVDGVVHLSPHVSDPMLDVIADAEVPVVVCGIPPADHHNKLLWSVTITDRTGARQATEHLQELGATRIGMIAGPLDALGSQEREIGFREALRQRFSEDLVEHGDYGRASGGTALAALLERHPDLDAVFCASDRMAVGALDEATRRGLRVPSDLLLVGFDDHEISRTSNPPLTTVRQPLRQLGRATVQMLTTALQGDDPGHRVFSTELVLRASTQPNRSQGGER
ncbi:LacI family DNA-binding transcriptional regulator [Luteococcus sp. H138]|uniref:LacI family DNA-binding transcriptional regulator n=1 Tax=unclassified Luteococcus TaxID=2639923 RepID=UPI00313ACB4F